MLLLTLVQKVLNDMESDVVNSISDTEEAVAVASIAEDVFNQFSVRSDWQSNKGVFNLENSNDLTKPTVLAIPDKLREVKTVYYDRQRLQYCERETFISLLMQNDPDATNNELVSLTDEFSAYAKNDSKPTRWTTFDNKTVVVDSWDKSAEDTVNGDKVTCLGVLNIDFTQTDDFVIPLEAHVLPTYVAEVKSACFAKLKQMSSAEDERFRRIGKSVLNREQKRAKGYVSSKRGFGRR